jgi:hypothetical protein
MKKYEVPKNGKQAMNVNAKGEMRHGLFMVYPKVKTKNGQK